MGVLAFLPGVVLMIRRDLAGRRSLRPHPFLSLSLSLGMMVSIVSCQKEDAEPRQENLKQQTVVFQEMAGVISHLTEGGDMAEGIAELDSLVVTLRDLKRELAVLPPPSPDEASELSGNEAFSQANHQFFRSLREFEASGKADPRVQRTLQGLHDPAPLKNEGKSD